MGLIAQEKSGFGSLLNYTHNYVLEAFSPHLPLQYINIYKQAYVHTKYGYIAE